MLFCIVLYSCLYYVCIVFVYFDSVLYSFLQFFVYMFHCFCLYKSLQYVCTIFVLCVVLVLYNKLLICTSIVFVYYDSNYQYRFLQFFVYMFHCFCLYICLQLFCIYLYCFVNTFVQFLYYVCIVVFVYFQDVPFVQFSIVICICSLFLFVQCFEHNTIV